MSLILCRQEQVKHPFFIDKLGIHIYSSEELCYVIVNHPFVAMDNFVDEELIAFIRNELGQGFLAGKLENMIAARTPVDDMLVTILQENDYYSSKEIHKFSQSLSSYRRMNRAELTKVMGDYYFHQKKYGTAIQYYERILNEWRLKSISNGFTAAVWNNIAASYAGIFWFDKAMEAYEMAYTFDKSKDVIRKMYQLTLFNPDLKVKDRFNTYITSDDRANWKKEFDSVMADGDDMRIVKSELDSIFEKDPIRRLEAAGKKVTSLKLEYRKMI